MIEIAIKQLQFTYPRSQFRLSIDDLIIAAGERVAVVGPSGSGKTTLLNLIAGIETPESGSIHVGSDVVSEMSDASRRDFRIAKIGMVFQQFELVEYLSVLQNILLPYSISGSLRLTNAHKHRARSLVERVGLSDKLSRRASQLSQGEQQRVAICRALVTEPQMILADEPTGNLDPRNKQTILDILFDMSMTSGQSLLVVTHDLQILSGFDRTIDFQDFTDDAKTNESAQEVAR